MNEDSQDLEHAVVSREEWLAARVALLEKEKDLTHRREELARERRALPWVRVDEPYVFETRAGQKTLAELFGRRRQLLLYHFMFAPEWDAGCKHCSFWADNYEGIGVHLAHRDVTLMAVSRAPLVKIDAFRERMGWTFEWVSSFGSRFNYDYGVSFTPEALRGSGALYNYTQRETRLTDLPGVSTFYKDAAGAVFHTYSTYARGLDILNGAYNHLDLVPKGRNEDALDFKQSWVRHHDDYGD